MRVRNTTEADPRDPAGGNMQSLPHVQEVMLQS